MDMERDVDMRWREDERRTWKGGGDEDVRESERVGR